MSQSPGKASPETRGLAALGLKLGLSRLALWWEGAWRALWPPLGVIGAFLVLAFTGFLPTLPPAQPVAPAPAPRAAPAVKPMSPLMEAKLAAEVQALSIENQLRLKKIESIDAEIQQTKAQQSAGESVTQVSAAVQQAVSGFEKTASTIGESIGDALGVAVEKMTAIMGEAVQEVGSAVNNFTDTSRQNTERALQAIAKPKRIVREKGRVVGIE